MANNFSQDPNCCALWRMNQADYVGTDWTETDPGADLICYGRLVTWTTLPRSVETYLYKDFGINYFNGDFTHRFRTAASSALSRYSWCTCWGMANVIDDIKGIVDGGDDCLDVYWWCSDLSNNRQLILQIVENGVSRTDASVNLDVGWTEYYVTVIRDDDGGANGTGQITVPICTGNYYGKSGSSLVDTLQLDCSAGEQNDFRNLYAINTFNSGHITYNSTGYARDYDVDGTMQYFPGAADAIGQNDLFHTHDWRDLVNFKEGDGSADFEIDNGQYCERLDTYLDSTMPGKSGTAHTAFSACVWFRAESASGIHVLVGKNASGSTRSWELSVDGSVPTGLSLKWHIGGGAVKTLRLSVTWVTGRWYHVGCYIEEATPSAYIRLYDSVTEQVSTATTSQESPQIFESAAPLRVGTNYDGLTDEVVVFNDVLTPAEIDQIRMGLYGAAWEMTIEATTSLIFIFSALGMAPLLGRWTWPVTERLAFNTEILQSHERTEQRIAKRQGICDHQIGTKIALAGDAEVAKFEAVIHGWLKRYWPVPLWPQAEHYQGELLAGSGEIPINTQYADFRVGAYILIWESAAKYELAAVSDVQDDLLTLTGEITNTYDFPWIMPLRIGRCVSAATAERYHGGALAQIFWRIVDVLAVEGFEPELSYDGLPVLTEPSWMAGDAINSSHDPDIAILDTGSGPFQIISNSDYNIAVQPHVWQALTKAKSWWLRQFFHAVRGRQAAFLVPTFRNDMILSRQVDADDTDIYIQNNGIAQNMGANDLRKYLAFRPAGQQIIVRKIIAISVVSDEEEKITTNPPEQVFAEGQPLCFVDRCRLANDGLEMQWYGRGKCSIETELLRVVS